MALSGDTLIVALVGDTHSGLVMGTHIVALVGDTHCTLVGDNDSALGGDTLIVALVGDIHGDLVRGHSHSGFGRRHP